VAAEYLSGEQIARYERFVGEPSIQELEEFFRLDAVAMEQAVSNVYSRVRG
jgi:hypothetical protein